MRFYICLIIFILMTSLIKSKKKQSYIIILTLFIFSILRANTVGADIKNYINYFHLSHTMGKEYFIFNIEKGYLLLNKLVSFFTHNEKFLILILSLPLFLINKHILKKSKRIWLSYFLFVSLGFYIDSFNIVRQFIATTVLLSSLKSIEKRSFKNFIKYLIIATFFHSTAIVFIILYFIYPLSINKKYIFSFLTILGLNLLLTKKILFFIIKNFSRYHIYMEHFFQGKGKSLLFFYLIILLLIFILKKKKNFKNDKIYIHMMSLTILLQSFAISFSVFTRITRYFFISIIILVPNIIYEQKDKKNKYTALSIILVSMTIFYILTLKKDSSQVIPYLFFFE